MLEKRDDVHKTPSKLLYLHSIARSHEKILFWVLKAGETRQCGITLVQNLLIQLSCVWLQARSLPLPHGITLHGPELR